MNRINKFTSIFGENWLTGRYLLPELARIGSKQKGIVLDLACGESPFKPWFPSVESYLRVDRHAVDDGVTSGDMRSIPMPKQSVDMILLFQAITDVSDLTSVFKEMKRVLRPGGQILMFESMAYPEHDTPHDYYRLMPEGLRVLSGEEGFELRECIRLGGLFTRFACLWNNFVMGGLKHYSFFIPLAHLGVVGANLVCYLLDKVMLYPRLASNYLAVLELSSDTKNQVSPSVEATKQIC